MGYGFIRTGPAVDGARVTLRCIVTLVCVAWALFWGIGALSSSNIEQRGQWGDSFGALNTLFSGLAFGVLTLALLLQSKQLQKQSEELELQREELKLTREELARTTQVQEGTKAVLEKQQEYLARSAQAQALAALGDTDRILGAVMKTAWRQEVGKHEGVSLTPSETVDFEDFSEKFRAARMRFVARACRDLVGFESS